MKEFAVKLCQEEYGHLLLLAAFDCIDDTVLVSKALVAVICTVFSVALSCYDPFSISYSQS